MIENLCLMCGACCVSFRVSFYWGEADPEQSGLVPIELTESITPFRYCMKGTNQPRPHCAALVGEPGGTNNCSIYEVRPTPCRDFRAAWEPGVSADEAARCNRARARFGLTALTPVLP